MKMQLSICLLYGTEHITKVQIPFLNLKVIILFFYSSALISSFLFPSNGTCHFFQILGKRIYTYVYLHVIIFSVSLALFMLFIPQATRGVSEYIKNFYNHEQCSSNYRKVPYGSQSLSSSNYKTSSD